MDCSRSLSTGPKLRITGRFAPVSLSQWRVQPADVVPGLGNVERRHGRSAGYCRTDCSHVGREERHVRAWRPGSRDWGARYFGASLRCQTPPGRLVLAGSSTPNGTRELRFVPVGNDTVVLPGIVMATSELRRCSFAEGPPSEQRPASPHLGSSRPTGRSFAPAWALSSVSRSTN